MAEGRTYVCEWEAVEGGVRAWLRQRRAIEATGATIDEVSDSLAAAVCAAFGDGEPQLEFVPSLPSAAHPSLTHSDVVSIVGQGQVHAKNDPDTLFTGGYCIACGAPLGRRTEERLVLSFVEAAHDGHFDLCLTGRRLRVALYSEEFIGLLPPSLRSGFEWRPTERRAGARRQFFECIASDHLGWAAPAEIPMSGGRCPDCGTVSMMREWLGRSENKLPYKYLSEVAVPKERPFLRLAGSRRDPTLVCSEPLWESIRGRRGARGIKASRVGVVRNDRSIAPPIRAVGR